MTESLTESSEILNTRLSSIYSEIDKLESSLNQLILQKRKIEGELNIRQKRERNAIVNEYKEKLSLLLTNYEYNLIIDTIKKTCFPELLHNDIREIYNNILNLKTKFSMLNIKLDEFRFSHREDKSASLNYTFKIDDYPDVFIGYTNCERVLSQFKLKKIQELNTDDTYSFLTLQEKEILCRFLLSENDVDVEKLLVKLRRVKRTFPYANIFHISLNMRCEIIIYIT